MPRESSKEETEQKRKKRDREGENNFPETSVKIRQQKKEPFSFYNTRYIVFIEYKGICVCLIFGDSGYMSNKNYGNRF